MPKLVADAPRVFRTGVLLLAAVGLLIAALSTGHVGLAWGSVALSAVAAVMILRRWRRSWLARQDAPEDESDLLAEDESDAAEQHLAPRPVAAGQDGDSGSAFAELGDSPAGDAAPGEEETDAAKVWSSCQYCRTEASSWGNDGCAATASAVPTSAETLG